MTDKISALLLDYVSCIDGAAIADRSTMFLEGLYVAIVKKPLKEK